MKRIILAVLCTALVLTALTSCGKKEKNDFGDGCHPPHCSDDPGRYT